ncbi:hypothetical protein CsSME_00025359 [Camellia sinensis var. sinensis]
MVKDIRARARARARASSMRAVKNSLQNWQCWDVPLAAGVDNTFRRKFDREEYLERAREREQKVLCLSVLI